MVQGPTWQIRRDTQCSSKAVKSQCIKRCLPLRISDSEWPELLTKIFVSVKQLYKLSDNDFGVPPTAGIKGFKIAQTSETSQDPASPTHRNLRTIVYQTITAVCWAMKTVTVPMERPHRDRYAFNWELISARVSQSRQTARFSGLF